MPSSASPQAVTASERQAKYRRTKPSRTIETEFWPLDLAAAEVLMERWSCTRTEAIRRALREAAARE